MDNILTDDNLKSILPNENIWIPNQNIIKIYSSVSYSQYCKLIIASGNDLLLS